MNDNKIISSSEMMMHVMNLTPMSGNELPSVWKKVVSKVRSYKDDSEDSERRMPIGERLAGNTRVIDLKNGILLVETDHPGWIQYLRMYQKFILNGLKMALPELKIKGLAFRVAGSCVSLSDTYEEQLQKEKEEAEKRLEAQEEKLKEFSKSDKNDEKSANSSTLPPEILAKFDSIKADILTNSKDK